jgi:hypothetical protein
MSVAAAAKAPSERRAEAAPPTLTQARSLRLHKRCACGGDAGLAGECDTCAGNHFAVQRRSDGREPQTGVPASVERTMSQPGRPLDGSTRGFMEGRFSRDLSSVRVHDDAAAGQSARDVQALAYTVGQDIVFAPGQYQPNSHAGRHLLAHELAHTVQQRGLQRSGTAGLTDQGPEYRILEAQADQAADAVMRGDPSQRLAPARRPMLSRAPTPTPASAPAPTPITVIADGLGTLNFQVTPAAAAAGGAGPVQAQFLVDPFYLPGKKGERARDIYDGRARARQLVAVLQIVGTSAQRTAQWQQRDRPDVLGDSWVRAVRWTAANRDTNWIALSGGPAFPASADGTCNIDHIVELQLSGGNDPANLQALDAEPNQFSGRTIWNEVRGLGSEIARAFSVPASSQVHIIFGSVEVVPPVVSHVIVAGQPISCLMIDRAARAGVEGRAVTDAAGASANSVQLVAGAATNDFVIPGTWDATAPDAPLAVNPANTAAAQMISGMILETLHYGSATAATFTARFDPRSGRRGTRLPLAVELERNNTIGLTATRQAATPAAASATAAAPPTAGAAGARPRVIYRLNLTDHTTNIAFNYTFLSPGRITRLGFAPDGAMHFRGEITPQIAFLPRSLQVVYENDVLRLAVPLNPSSLRSPLPGFTLTGGALELGLSPTLTASGHLDFAIGSGDRAIAIGTVRVDADETGLSATGNLQARIPGVDEARGDVTYRGGRWSAQIVVESTQIRLPNVQRGRLQLDINDTGLHPSGELELLLPRNLGNATLGFTREGTHFVYTGRGTLRVPGLREVSINARYDGTTLIASAQNIGFTWHGLDGTVNVTYTARGDSPGNVTGTGRLTLARGDVTGTIDVTLHDSGRFSGRGRVTYPLAIRGQRLEASAGVIVEENQSVRVEGALRLPQPIEMFGRFGDNKQLFHFQRNIPIPGLSIGPVGVVAVIEGGVSARYGIGPGQLRNVALEAAFNPLAEHIDPNVSFHCELHVPAAAGIAGTIGGGLGVEAGLGRVNGTLTVTADLGLDATLGGPLDLRYQDRRFAVTARPGIDASLGLGLSLDAHARAEAGIGRFSVGTEKTWYLGRRAVVLGRFSMFAPIGWSSEGGFNPPSIDQIEWGPMPEIDPADLLSQLFRSSTTQEREA